VLVLEDRVREIDLCIAFKRFLVSTNDMQMIRLFCHNPGVGDRALLELQAKVTLHFNLLVRVTLLAMQSFKNASI